MINYSLNKEVVGELISTWRTPKLLDDSTTNPKAKTSKE
jgi:hypothetical protein